MNLDFARQSLRAHYPTLRRARLSTLRAEPWDGDDPLDEDECPSSMRARTKRSSKPMRDALLATFLWHKEPAAQISWRRILHREQSFSLSRSLPVEAAVRGRHFVVAAEDKGSSRGAVLYTAQDRGRTCEDRYGSP